MANSVDRHNSIPIVSGSEQFDAVVRNSLPQKDFAAIDFRKTASSGRRTLLERYYDIVLINAPLQDEIGYDLAMDIAEHGNASILIAVPSEIYEDVLEYVTDHGILVISKPLAHGIVNKSIRFLLAAQDRIHKLECRIRSAEEKLEETRIVDKAKFMLVEQKHISEDEAHRFIGKQAMNHGVSRKRIAQRIIDELE